MLRPLTVALIVLLLAAPSAQAGWLDRDVAITTAPERAGDRLSYETIMTPPQLDARADAAERGTDAMASFERAERVVLVEGASRALDAYGIERATVAYRIDLASDGVVHWATRCHRLADGLATVRVDHLGAIEPEPAGEKQAPERGGMTAQPTVQFDADACMPATALAGREFVEGDTLRFEEVDAIRAWGDALGLVSEPAVATEFQGRPALSFTFRVPEGAMTYVLADGLPAYAESVMEYATEDGSGVAERTTLVGYEPGDEASVLASGEAALPARHPDAVFRAPDPLTLDDEAFALAFPYADAYAALLADPTARFPEWRDAHPDAVLVFAMYDRDARDPSAVGLSTQGTWNLGFADGTAGMMYTIVRVAGASTPLGPIATPTTSDRVTSATEYDASGHGALPAELAENAILAEVAARHGLDVTAISALTYALTDGAYLQLTMGDPSGDATHLVLDPATGGAAMGYMTSRAPGGLLGFFTGGVAREREGAFAAVDAPTAIVVGSAAATGLGLLLWLVLIPLFTRLRRDRLLDNPVRARLYERIRAEPGIHRAELVDFAGIGEGATRHHLAQLAKHRLILETAQDGFVRYFAAGEVPPLVARREALLRAGSHRAVYELYAREPTLSLRDAGARLGMSAPSVHRAKKKLEAAGLLPAAPDATGFVAEA